MKMRYPFGFFALLCGCLFPWTAFGQSQAKPGELSLRSIAAKQTGTMHYAKQVVISLGKRAPLRLTTDVKRGRFAPLGAKAFRLSQARHLVVGHYSTGAGMQTSVAFLIQESPRRLRLLDTLTYRRSRGNKGIVVRPTPKGVEVGIAHPPKGPRHPASWRLQSKELRLDLAMLRKLKYIRRVPSRPKLARLVMPKGRFALSFHPRAIPKHRSVWFSGIYAYDQLEPLASVARVTASSFFCKGKRCHKPGHIIARHGKTRSWCEGKAGHGVGAWIHVDLGRSLRLYGLRVLPFVLGKAGAALDYARVKELEITTQAGTFLATFPEHPRHLKKRLHGKQPIERTNALHGIHLGVKTSWLKLKIRSVYRGRRHATLCLGQLELYTPDIPMTKPAKAPLRRVP